MFRSVDSVGVTQGGTSGPNLFAIKSTDIILPKVMQFRARVLKVKRIAVV